MNNKTLKTYTYILVSGLNLHNRLSQVLSLKDTDSVVLLEELGSVQVPGYSYEHSRGGTFLWCAPILCQHSNLLSFSNRS